METAHIPSSLIEPNRGQIDGVPANPRVITDEVAPRVKRGEVWKLGRHRLMCGDCTSPDDMATLMDGEKASMVFADPPYGMGKTKKGVQGDNVYGNDLLEFNKTWIPLSFEHLSPVGSWYCWGREQPIMDMYSHILVPRFSVGGEDKLTFRNLIVWDKRYGPSMSSGSARMYAPLAEFCLFVMRGRQTYGDCCADYWDGFEPLRQKLLAELRKSGMTQAEIMRRVGVSTISHWFSRSQWEFPSERTYKKVQAACKEYEAFAQEYDELRQEWYKTRAFFDNTHGNFNSVWHFDHASKEERADAAFFPTIKPIALCERAIKSSSREGEVILDPFGGSGSTLMACEANARQCRMMEINERNASNIIARWERTSGRKAERL